MADTVRQRFIESLARRAAGHQGAARRVLDERLAQLSQAATEVHETHEVADAPTSGPSAPGALAELVEHLARHKLVAPSHLPRQADSPAPPTLQFFRRTWSRLSAEQRLAQSRAALPENAGPLNSQHLVHRALTQMQALSPAYLEHFVAHVEALLWLERSKGGGGRRG